MCWDVCKPSENWVESDVEEVEWGILLYPTLNFTSLLGGRLATWQINMALGEPEMLTARGFQIDKVTSWGEEMWHFVETPGDTWDAGMNWPGKFDSGMGSFHQPSQKTSQQTRSAFSLEDFYRHLWELTGLIFRKIIQDCHAAKICCRSDETTGDGSHPWLAFNRFQHVSTGEKSHHDPLIFLYECHSKWALFPWFHEWF